MSKINYKELKEKIQSYISDLIQDTTSAKELNKMIDDLYHRDMTQTKVDIEMYRHYFDNNYNWCTESKILPAGSWVFIDHNEGGTYAFDETQSYHCDVYDYSTAKNIFERNN